MSTKVVHVSRSLYDVYIGRGPDPNTGIVGKWGNPFRITDTLSRKECIKKYMEWFLDQERLIANLHELKDETLGCYCRPKLCHGDFLAKLADMSELVACGISQNTFNEVSKAGSGYDDSWMEVYCHRCGWYESTGEWFEACEECGSVYVANTGSWFCDVKSEPRMISVLPNRPGNPGGEILYCKEWSTGYRPENPGGKILDGHDWHVQYNAWKDGILAKLADKDIPAEDKPDEGGIFGKD